MITILVMIFLFRALSNEFWNVKKKNSFSVSKTNHCACVLIVLLSFSSFFVTIIMIIIVTILYIEKTRKNARTVVPLCVKLLSLIDISSEIDAFFFTFLSARR